MARPRRRDRARRDRPADDQKIGAGGECLARPHDAFLVARGEPHQADAGHRQQEIRTAGLAQHGRLERRADDAVEAAVAGQQREAPHLLGGGAALAHLVEIAVIEAGRAPSPQQLEALPVGHRLRRRLGRGAQHRLAAAAVHRQQQRPEPGRRRAPRRRRCWGCRAA